MRYYSYYLSLRPDLSNHFVVHRHGCPLIQIKKGTIFIGKFAGIEEALISCRRFKIKPRECIFCCKSGKTDQNINNRVPGLSKIELITYEEIVPSPESGLACGVN
jgi:hypothetical protein